MNPDPSQIRIGIGLSVKTILNREAHEIFFDEKKCLNVVQARDTGVWDPHGLNFCVVTFEQVFGNSVDNLREESRRSHQGITDETFQIHNP